MTRVYTKLLGSVQIAAPGADVQLAVAPDGYVTILRDLIVLSSTAGTSQFYIYRVTGGATRILVREDLPYPGTYHLDFRQVLPVGSELRIGAGPGQVDASITGYQLVDDGQ